MKYYLELFRKNGISICSQHLHKIPKRAKSKIVRKGIELWDQARKVAGL